MEAITSFHDVALTNESAPLLALGDEGKVAAAYATFFSNPLHKYSQDEYAIEALAHDCIDKNQAKMALLLSQLNLRSNPSSSLAFDGLGDALAALKQKGEALRAYRAALRIDPKDAIAASSISQLESQR